MNGNAWSCALLLLACAGSAIAADEAIDPGTYLSAQLGGGRISGGAFDSKPGANPWMRSRAGELRIGRPLSGAASSRIDVVYINEGHPDNNHRDGYALQWSKVWRDGERLSGEFGIGPYFSMNTTAIDGRQLDDARWGVLLSVALRLGLSSAPDGTYVRLGFNHAQMPGVHRSDALMLGVARQFGAVAQEHDPDAARPFWLGVSAGTAVTSMPDTNTGSSAIVDAGRDLNRGATHWAWSARWLFEGDDGRRVDRRGLAGQLWYVQEVTPGFSMSAGIGPYLSRNRREAPPDHERTRRNVLISLQAERALSPQTHVFFDFGRVKTFLRMDDRDLFLVGIRKRF
jgi:hypothetical protein